MYHFFGFRVVAKVTQREAIGRTGARASVEQKGEDQRIWFVVPSAVLVATAVALCWLRLGGFIVGFFSG
jgi:hypothetical protein